jgi:tetratricopeptide (TPR) repeat protein
MAPATGLLSGHKVAFTGKLASMTRARAAVLVREHGGAWSPAVTRDTSFLVVGQDGWPLDHKGRLTSKLQKARRLPRVRVIGEADLLARLRLEPVASRLAITQVSRALHISGDAIRRWVDLGLLQPAETCQGVHYFDFRQASWARTLCEFASAGVSIQRIKRSLEQLRRWLPDVQEPLDQLAVLEKDGRLLVRLQDEQLADASGQLQLDFGQPPEASALRLESAPAARFRETDKAANWFARACRAEDEGNWAETVWAYRQALQAGGSDAALAFNLANALYALGNKQQAAERYRQSIEIDPTLTEAWNNLGNVLAELHEYPEAIEALETALRLDPSYSDAHYNLADVLEEAGRSEEASTHWRAYLRWQPQGPWAAYARRRLDA